MGLKALYQRRDSITRGRHLVATQPISKGQLIFVEKPLLSLQSLGNAHAGALVCRSCRAFVGGPDLCLKVVSGMINRDDLGKSVVKASLDDCTNRSGEIVLVPCRHKCGELYCSYNCEKAMWEYGGHQLLCTGLLPDPPADEGDTNSHENLHPLLKFKLHAVRNNEIFLMVADLVVTVLSLYRKQLEIFVFSQKNNRRSEQDEAITLPVTLSNILSPYLDFSLTPWWEVATASLSPPEAHQLDETLRMLCKDSSVLLRDALMALTQGSYPTSIDVDAPDRTQYQLSLQQAIQDCDELFSEQFFGKIIGSFEQNSIGLRARHPLCRDVLEISSFREKYLSELVLSLKNEGLLCDEGASVGEDSYKNENYMNIQEQTFTRDEIDHILAGLYIEEEGMGIQDKEILLSATADGDEIDESDGDDLDILFTPLDGTAMYQTACKMNHSCDPNVMVRYSFSRIPGGMNRWGQNFPLVLECVARRDIDTDEELCISYVNRAKSLPERQEELLNTYGFRCTCMRCRSELHLNRIEAKSDVSYQSSIDQVFGEDDETMSEDANDAGKDLDLNGMEKLNHVVRKLNEQVVTFAWGHLPWPIFSSIVSYIVQNGTELVSMLITSAGSNTLSLEKDLSETIKQCISSLSARDFSICIHLATKVESFLLKSFFSNGSWQSNLIQKAYLICALVASVAYAQNLNFRIALSFVDRAFIIGLSRVEIGPFYDYVSYHSQFRSHVYEIYLSIMSFDTVKPPDVSSIVIKNPILEVMNGLSSTGIAEAMRNDKAVLVRNFAGSWPAISKWRSFTFLVSEHGHRIVPIEVGDMVSGMTERMMTLSSFYEDYLGPIAESNQGVAYLAQHLLCDQIPELLQDIVIDPEFYKTESKINMWIGTKGTRTPLHYDSLDNLFVQISGTKYVRLYGAEETGKLYVTKNATYGKQGNMSSIDCEREDLHKHPLAATARYEEAILHPGDALFIPSKMWHYVRGLSRSISINFWS